MHNELRFEPRAHVIRNSNPKEFRFWIAEFLHRKKNAAFTGAVDT